VGLILYVDGGGHIFQRPDYDEPRNFFVIIYGIVGKYAIQMQPQHDGLELDISSLLIEEKILLINHEAQKLLFLGDHWIGDGQKFSIMETGDYHRLKQLFAETRKARDGPTKEDILENYGVHIHKIWADDPENYYREFYFPAAKPIPVPSSADTTTNQPMPDIKADAHSKREMKTDAQSRQGTQTNNEKKKIILPEEKKSFAINSFPTPSRQQGMQVNSVQQQEIRTTGETHLKHGVWILLLTSFLLVGYWRMRGNK
jgi:hypothetical protein